MLINRGQLTEFNAKICCTTYKKSCVYATNVLILLSETRGKGQHPKTAARSNLNDMISNLEHIIQLHRAARKCEGAASTAEGIDKQYYLEAAAATYAQAMSELEAAWRRASAERDRLNEAAAATKAERRTK